MITYLVSILLGIASIQNSDSNVQVLPVPPTPESGSIVLKIAIPQKNQIVGNPVWVQFRIDGFALGAASQFDRASEVADSSLGQTVHVIVDDYPYFPINEPALDPFDESGYYYDMSYKFKIPFRLSSGKHTLRMFPARSFGESLKGENTYAAIYFYVGEEKNNSKIDLSKPYITYNEPSPLMPLVEGQPVLLDFYLNNVELSPDGYKVRLTIDGKIHRILTSWQPYYIYGLKKGRHTIRLELFDKENKLVYGSFNNVKEYIEIN